MVVYEAADSLLQSHFAKIDQEPYGQMQKAKIGQKLLCMNRMQLLNRLQFNHEPILDQQIDPRSIAKLNSVKLDIDPRLPIYLISHQRKTPGQQSLVDALQQPGSNLAVQPHGNADHVM